MKFQLSKELPAVSIALIPLVYLYYLWNKLPEKVPIHWNLVGEIDRFGSKSELILLVFLMPILTYIIFLIIPYLDPKKKIQLMGEKYSNLKLLIILMISLITIFILNTVQLGEKSNMNIVFGFGASMIIIVGNYMRNMGQNYFIGIRTPWTLKNERVWKEVHRSASYLWVGGGILCLLLCLILPFEVYYIMFLSILGILTIGPIIHSYLLFKKYTNHA